MNLLALHLASDQEAENLALATLTAGFAADGA